MAIPAMIGVDTNILLRWLVRDADNVQQSEAAAQIMSRDDIHVSSIAIAEMVWVLNRRYKLGRSNIADTVKAVLSLRNVTVDFPELVRQALDDFVAHAGDFNDHLIARHDHAAGCAYTLTFDKKAAPSKRFKLI